MKRLPFIRLTVLAGYQRLDYPIGVARTANNLGLAILFTIAALPPCKLSTSPVYELLVGGSEQLWK
jgi:hypothetical protein